MWVVRKLLSPTEGAPPRTRVNPDTGEVETNVSGDEWVPDPNSDPRQNPAYMLPPPSAPDVQCAAAAGMVENVRRVVTGAAGGTTVASIATLLLTLLLIPGIGWMFAAMLLFASSFVAAGSAAVLAAFTEDVYDWLLCAFYEQVDAEGRITWTALEDIHTAAIGHFLDPLVPDILAGIFQMHREVGFTNAGVVYADPDADCSCLPEHCLEVDLTLTDGSEYGVALSPGGGTWQAGLGYESVAFDSGQDVTVVFVFPDALTCTAVEAQYSKTTASGAFDVNNLRALNPYTNYAVTQVAIDPTNDLGEHLVKAIIFPLGQILEGYSIDVNTGSTGGPTKAYVERLIVRYRGDIPEGWIDNCPEE